MAPISIMKFSFVPGRESGFAVTACLDLIALSLTHAERTDARIQKAKDWDGLRTIDKRDPVET